MSTSPLVARMAGFTSTVFAEMSGLATRPGAVNLGQGFPDTDGPQEMLDAAVEAIRSGLNQYPPGPGMPALLTAIAAHQSRFYGLDVDPDTEVLVTVGATEAIAAAILALCEAGDEVVVFEPYYDSYAASIALAGAVRKTAVLRFPDFTVDEDELRRAFSAKTRLVLLNTPHNPTGKVFTRAELELVARLAQEYDAWVVADEVYEHLTFDGVQHVAIASLPGMRERTLTISSAGKTFSATGWKVGWVTGPAAAVAAVRAVKQFLTYVGSGPFQPAVAVALDLPDSVYAQLRDSLQAKRDVLCAGLTEAGFTVSRPSGTYFVVADTRGIGAADAEALGWELPEKVGVAAIPVNVFHDDKSAGRSLLRFAFCKKDEVLAEAVRRLAEHSAAS